MKRIDSIYSAICEKNPRSAWDKGVKAYALDLLGSIRESIEGGYESDEILHHPSEILRVALNGAQDWKQYSEGGCSLVYDADIAERLCTPSELRRTRNGERRPNSREDWIDVQAGALRQAFFMICRAARNVR